MPSEKRYVAMWRKARKRGKIIVWKTNMAENIVYRWIYCFVRDEIALLVRVFASCGRGKKKGRGKAFVFPLKSLELLQKGHRLL